MSSLPHPIRAVLFDMDGTLLDTERLYLDAIRGACSDLGCVAEDVLLKQMVGRPWSYCYDLMHARFGRHFLRERFDEHFERRISALLAPGVPVKDGAHDFLAYLKERQIQMAIATSTVRQIAESHLQLAGILHYFPVIVSRDMVENGKPSPDTFLKAAEILGIPAQQCLALEDSPAGVRAAAAAGAITIMIPDRLAATAKERELCWAVLESLSEVLDLLRRA